eukprot:1769940-Amphidinium_carterae.5
MFSPVRSQAVLTMHKLLKHQDGCQMFIMFCQLELGYKVDVPAESTDAVVCHDIVGQDQTIDLLMFLPCGTQATPFDCQGNLSFHQRAVHFADGSAR